MIHVKDIVELNAAVIQVRDAVYRHYFTSMWHLYTISVDLSSTLSLIIVNYTRTIR